MSKRFFGLDIGPGYARLAILHYDKDQLRTVSLLESLRQELPEQLAELRQQWNGEFRFGDRMAAALPAKSAYVRNLEFPFRNRKKIEAALPHAINLQIPVAVDECALAARFPSHKKEGPVQVEAVAASKQLVHHILDSADGAGLPLHILDLQPFALLSGLEGRISDGILISATADEITVSFLVDGRLLDYRILPGGTDLDGEDKIFFLQREIRTLLMNARQTAAPIYLTGKAMDDEIIRKWAQQGQSVERLSLRLAGEEIPEDYLPATTLALRAGKKQEQQLFNFRQGPFALKGEWQKIRGSLILMSCFVSLIVAILGIAAFVNYDTKTAQIDTLQQNMIEIHRQTFPDMEKIVDIPLQMQSALQDLRARSLLIGTASPSVLAVLRAVSDVPDTMNIEIREFSYSPEEVRILGYAESFEDVNGLTDRLNGSSLFTRVQIAEAQMTPTTNKINFRLLLHLIGKESNQ